MKNSNRSAPEERIPKPLITPKDRLKQQRKNPSPNVDDVDKEMERIFNVGMERTNMCKHREAHQSSATLPGKTRNSNSLTVYDDRDFHQVLEDEFLDTDIHVDQSQDNISGLSSQNIESRQTTDVPSDNVSKVGSEKMFHGSENQIVETGDNSLDIVVSDLTDAVGMVKPQNSDVKSASQSLTTINQNELWLCSNEAALTDQSNIDNKTSIDSVSCNEANSKEELTDQTNSNFMHPSEYPRCSSEHSNTVQNHVPMNKAKGGSLATDSTEIKNITLFGKNKIAPDLKTSHHPTNVGIVEPRVVLKIKVPGETTPKKSENCDKTKSLSTEKLLNFGSDYATEEEEEEKTTVSMPSTKLKKEKKKKKHKKHKKDRSSSCKCENNSTINQTINNETTSAKKSRVYCKECGKKKSKKYSNSNLPNSDTIKIKDNINPPSVLDSKQYNNLISEKSTEFYKLKTKVGGFTSVKDEGKIVKMKDYWRHKSMMSPHCSSPSSEFLPRVDEKGFKSVGAKSLTDYDKSDDPDRATVETQYQPSVSPRLPSMSPFDARILFTNRMVKAITSTSFERKEGEDRKRSRSMSDVPENDDKEVVEKSFFELLKPSQQEQKKRPFIKSNSVPSDLHIDFDFGNRVLPSDFTINQASDLTSNNDPVGSLITSEF